MLAQDQECSSGKIVMGTNNRRELTQMVFGSVAAYKVRHATILVLTVKVS